MLTSIIHRVIRAVQFTTCLPTSTGIWYTATLVQEKETFFLHFDVLRACLMKCIEIQDFLPCALWSAFALKNPLFPEKFGENCGQHKVRYGQPKHIKLVLFITDTRVNRKLIRIIYFWVEKKPNLWFSVVGGLQRGMNVPLISFSLFESICKIPLMSTNTSTQVCVSNPCG